MIDVVINYDLDLEIFKLYYKDLDVVFTSEEMFKVLVLFNSFISEHYGENFNILNSTEINYILDSYSMKQMILSNVKLIKRLSKMPSAFQQSNERFGSSSIVSSSHQFGASSKCKLSATEDFDKMMSKKRKFSSSKFK